MAEWEQEREGLRGSSSEAQHRADSEELHSVGGARREASSETGEEVLDFSFFWLCFVVHAAAGCRLWDAQPTTIRFPSCSEVRSSSAVVVYRHPSIHIRHASILPIPCAHVPLLHGLLPGPGSCWLVVFN